MSTRSLSNAYLREMDNSIQLLEKWENTKFGDATNVDVFEVVLRRN